MDRVRPVTPAGLAEEIARRATARPGWVRVAIDGPDAARPADLADAVAERVRASGRAAIRVRAEDHLRPASLRFEHGRTDPDSLYEDFLDAEGLVREVLGPLEPGHTGAIRPVRWDAAADRASRAGFTAAPPGAVLILSGALLLGRGLPLDLVAHLELTPRALARRTPPELAWTLPAFERYAAEVAPATWADVVVRYDDPRHPAIVEPG